MQRLSEREWEEMEFTCMVCGKPRSNNLTSVHYRPVPGLEHMFPPAGYDFRSGTKPGHAWTNVRYCNDSADCAAIAFEEGPWRGSALRQCEPGRGLHVYPHVDCVPPRHR